MEPNPKRIKVEQFELTELEIVYVGADSEAGITEADRQRLRDLQDIEKQIPNARFCRVEKTKIKVEPKIEVKEEPISDDERGSSDESIKPTQEKKFQCFDCKKELFSFGHLRRHQVIHRRKPPVKCGHCERMFNLLASKKNHEKICKSNPKAASVEDRAKFKCIECDKKFTSPYHLRRHQEIHSKSMDERTTFKCDDCDKAFTSISNLKNHQLINHVGIKRFKCKHCDRPFSRKGDKNLHEPICKSNPDAAPLDERATFECDECKKQFPTQKGLKNHQLIHAGIKNFKCDHCEKTFVRSSQKKVHEPLCKSNPDVKPLVERALHECDKCEKTFTTLNGLANHQLIHAGIKRHDCAHCKRAFRASTTRNRHERSCKSNKNAATLDERAVFKCDKCDKGFTTKSHLKRHQSIHISVEERAKFQCVDCNRLFTTMAYLKNHQLIHTTTLAERSKFECDKCEKSFTQLQTLRQHQLLHIATKEERAKFECDVCKKKFTQRTNLNQHKLNHTEVRAHKCTFCVRMFCVSRDRNRHESRCESNPSAELLKQRIRYECELCKKGFTKKTSYKMHQLGHIEKGRDIFECIFCKDEFSTIGVLRKHQMIHTVSLEGRAKFKCTVCGRKFTSMGLLNRHKLLHVGSKD